MDCDAVVVGAGVVGLAVAADLADAGLSVYVLERERSHGLGVSSRNSEVIHAGIYYPPGSLKAILCVEGRGLLYDLCARFGVAHRRLGKLIVATDVEEVPELERLLQNARACGVRSVRLVGQAEAKDLEPNVRRVAALYSPDTGIVNAHELMDACAARGAAHGSQLVCGTEVVGIEPIPGGYAVATRDREGRGFEIRAGRVVNAAGLQADTVAGMVGREYGLWYCKGDYFSVANVRKGTVTRLVYPAPEPRGAGLGIHLTLDFGGRMRLGPDATYVERREDYRVDPAKGDRFFAAASRYLPFLKPQDLSPDTSGIRPKLQAPGEGFRDFVISEDLPGFVNLIGIESPGLTSALAIARRVRAMVG